MRIFDAIWAFRYHGGTPRESRRFSGTASSNDGWIYLIAAAALIVCAFLVRTGSQVARWVGIVSGAIRCISAIWWMPYYPIWSLTYIAIGAVVIYAFAAYGGQAETS